MLVYRGAGLGRSHCIPLLYCTMVPVKHVTGTHTYIPDHVTKGNGRYEIDDEENQEHKETARGEDSAKLQMRDMYIIITCTFSFTKIKQ